MSLSADNEPTIQALLREVKKARGETPTQLGEASLRDSANNGAVEAAIRRRQQRARTLRDHAQEKYGLKLWAAHRALGLGTGARGDGGQCLSPASRWPHFLGGGFRRRLPRRGVSFRRDLPVRGTDLSHSAGDRAEL